jgi:hypothetical protein
MQQVVLALVGVILGAVIAGVLSYWQIQLVSTRERKVREALQEEHRRDRRLAFEQETLLAIQNALSDMRQVTLRDYERRMSLMAEQGFWPPPSTSLLLIDGWIQADDRLSTLRARVLDKELRELLEAFGQATTLAMTSSRFEGVNRRIGVLLPPLF